jgi:hypothetical protein
MPSRSLRGATSTARTQTEVQWQNNKNLSSFFDDEIVLQPDREQNIRDAIRLLISAPFNDARLAAEPLLSHAIEHDLGYRTTAAYIDMLSFNPKNVFDNVTRTIDLSRSAQLHERQRLDGFADNIDRRAPLMCHIDDHTFSESSRYEVIRLVPLPRSHSVTAQDTLVSFDGPSAGRAANAFVKLYQNGNDGFRSAMLALTQRQNGLYPVHTARMENTLRGYNYAEDDAYGLSGSYLNELIDSEWSLLRIMVHEIAHDLHNDASNLGVLDGLTRDTGEVHSREQSAFIVSVLSELVAKGEIEARHTDSIDYANDLSLVDIYLPPTDNVIDGNYSATTPNAFETLQDQILTVLNNINAGDHQKAAKVLADLPPDASISLQAKNPQTGDLTPAVEYNVRELILQHCLIGYNAERFYGADHSGLTQLKTELPHFLAALNSQDPSFMQYLEKAANTLYLPLRHLPLNGNLNLAQDPAARITPQQSYGPYAPASQGWRCNNNPFSHSQTTPKIDRNTASDCKDALKHWQSYAIVGGSYALGLITMLAVNQLRR